MGIAVRAAMKKSCSLIGKGIILALAYAGAFLAGWLGVGMVFFLIDEILKR